MFWVIGLRGMFAATMKEIPLTRGMVVRVDDDDFEWLSQWRWHVKVYQRFKAKIYYAARSDNSNKKTILMHRSICKPNGNYKIDHIDRDGLNNQKNNLRIATQGENTRNKTSAIDSSSKYLGVDYMKARRKWRARIMHNGKDKHIGLFVNEKDAAIAYDKCAKIHGEFANLNFK